MKGGRAGDAVTFSSLCRKFRACTDLKDRASILTFLSALYSTGNQHGKYARFSGELTHGASSMAEINHRKNDSSVDRRNTSVCPKVSILSSEERYVNVLSTTSEHEAFEGSLESKACVERGLAMLPEQVVAEPCKKCSAKCKTISVVDTSSRGELNLKCQKCSMLELVQDVLYAVQGISGTNIIWKEEHWDFVADIKSTIPNLESKLVRRFADIGRMYLKINNFCTLSEIDKNLGLMQRSFMYAIKEELMEFYRLLAILQGQLKDSENKPSAVPSLTLHRLSVHFLDPYRRLKFLATLVDVASDKMGGALASVLYMYSQHGDKLLSDMVKRILIKTILPLYKMIYDWIFHGELMDVFGEFFVTANTSFSQSSMWQKEYSLDEMMIPEFISKGKAERILSCGKSINFLKDVCGETLERTHVVTEKVCSPENASSLLLQNINNEFQVMLDEVYLKNSDKLLTCLFNKHHLMEHFHAMRSYLLLGQGDFMHHLMDMLVPYLGNPADSLHLYILSRVLDSAVLATNAQYHSPDILQRLDVDFLDFSLGDTGWDVFSLRYRVDGPIETIFTPEDMISYLRLFNSLWRAKRMEYILMNISQSRKKYCLLQKQIPEVAPIAHLCHVILFQMVHLIQQVQYYLALEVVECSWADLLQKIEKVKDLDEVIKAHKDFLDMLLDKSLLKDESNVLQTQLRAIYYRMIEFDKIQEEFWSEVDELSLMAKTQEPNIYQKKLSNLKETVIPSVKAELNILIYSYLEMVEDFLRLLNDHPKHYLKCLCLRLDFNDYFKSRYLSLGTSSNFVHINRPLKNILLLA